MLGDFPQASDQMWGMDGQKGDNWSGTRDILDCRSARGLLVRLVKATLSTQESDCYSWER